MNPINLKLFNKSLIFGMIFYTNWQNKVPSYELV